MCPAYDDSEAHSLQASQQLVSTHRLQVATMLNVASYVSAKLFEIQFILNGAFPGTHIQR